MIKRSLQRVASVFAGVLIAHVDELGEIQMFFLCKYTRDLTLLERKNIFDLGIFPLSFPMTEIVVQISIIFCETVGYLGFLGSRYLGI